MACHKGLLFGAERPEALGAGIHTETVPENCYINALRFFWRQLTSEYGEDFSEKTAPTAKGAATVKCNGTSNALDHL